MRIAAKVRSLSRDTRFRYLVVGATNTVVGYSLYGALLLGFGDAAYLFALIVSHVVATTVAFFLYRRFVFDVSGSHLLDYVRFQLVYLISLGLNVVLLALVVSTTPVQPLFAQGMCLLVVALASFLGHRHFSFRRSKARR